LPVAPNITKVQSSMSLANLVSKSIVRKPDAETQTTLF
jgi:hypothetical protein